DERLDVADDRREAQPAAVDVGRQRPRQADAVHARLLLPDRPRLGLTDLLALEVADQLRPFDAALDLDLSSLPVEAHDAVEGLHVEQDRVGAELLAAHRVPAASHADSPPLAPGGAQGGVNVVETRGLDDPVDARGVQPRLDVVDLDSRALRG